MGCWGEVAELSWCRVTSVVVPGLAKDWASAARVLLLLQAWVVTVGVLLLQAMGVLLLHLLQVLLALAVMGVLLLQLLQVLLALAFLSLLGLRVSHVRR